MFSLALLFVVLALVASLAVGAWRLLRSKGRLPAMVGVTAITLLAVGLAPLPIHGGFTTPLFEVVSGLKHAPQQVDGARDAVARALWEQRLAARFQGTLDFTDVGEAGGPWRAVVTAEGERAWLDDSTGLVWSRAEPIEATGIELFEAARASCARRRPTGRWAVPSEAEMISFARSNGAAVAGGPAFNDVTVSLDARQLVELPVRRVPRGEARGRCVARSSAAPLGGLTNDAVSLDEWNRFQLSK